MGSSGVGKSTLVNSSLGDFQQATGGIRHDSKGRHTTTSRSLHLLSSGGLLLDTPGMRELQLADCAEGVSETFSDVEELAMHCRFSDCSHESEPGCAIRKAIESGELSERRFSNYEKLLREQQETEPHWQNRERAVSSFLKCTKPCNRRAVISRNRLNNHFLD